MRKKLLTRSLKNGRGEIKSNNVPYRNETATSIPREATAGQRTSKIVAKDRVTHT